MKWVGRKGEDERRHGPVQNLVVGFGCRVQGVMGLLSEGIRNSCGILGRE